MFLTLARIPRQSGSMTVVTPDHISVLLNWTTPSKILILFVQLLFFSAGPLAQHCNLFDILSS